MDEKKIAQLFIQLVLQNQQMAMISLGKLKNPVSDAIEKNHEYAKFSIDMLDMLKEKTNGNLSEQEEKFLTESLTQLKVLYVEKSAKEKKPEHKPNKENQEKE